MFTVHWITIDDPDEQSSEFDFYEEAASFEEGLALTIYTQYYFKLWLEQDGLILHNTEKNSA